MELKDANIKDLVDAIEYQLKNITKAEDIIEEKHQIQLPAMAGFNEQIRRLRDILDEHIKTL
jgi:anaerobic glycerol-3-phosphate dehydrogenase